MLVSQSEPAGGEAEQALNSPVAEQAPCTAKGFWTNSEQLKLNEMRVSESCISDTYDANCKVSQLPVAWRHGMSHRLNIWDSQNCLNSIM